MDEGLLIEELARDEGLRLRPYRDTVDKLTIGYGRNLDDQGISKDEASMLLLNDIREVEKDLTREFPWWVNLNNSRQRALANMCFNLGITRLGSFNNMIAALILGDYKRAADEALDSKWARQVGTRADRIADLIRQG